jgi:hypothetical protein
VNQTQRSYRGCNRAAQSRGARQSAPYAGTPLKSRKSEEAGKKKNLFRFLLGGEQPVTEECHGPAVMRLTTGHASASSQVVNSGNAAPRRRFRVRVGAEARSPVRSRCGGRDA